MPKYDVAVAGAGLGGLAAAALLAVRKKKIIVLERGRSLNEAAGVFERNGIAFFAAPPLSYGFEPGGAFQELCTDLGLVQETSVHSPGYQVALPDRRITLFPEWNDTLEELKREFPREIVALERFHRDLRKEATWNKKSRISSYLSKHRVASGFLRKHRFSRELTAFFDVQALFFFQKRAGDLSLASLITLCDTPPRYPDSGFHRLAEQLRGIVLREGGDIRMNEQISGLAMNKKRVIGLQTEKSVVEADAVLLNSAQQRLSKTVFLGIRKEVIPVGMCRHVLFLPDYARPNDYVSLSLHAEDDAAAPPGMKALCVSYCSQQEIAVDSRAIIEQSRKLIPFLDDYLVFADEYPVADGDAAFGEGITFQRLRSSDGTALLFRGSKKNVYLLRNEHSAPLQVLSAAKRFARTVR